MNKNIQTQITNHQINFNHQIQNNKSCKQPFLFKYYDLLNLVIILLFVIWI